MASLDNLKAVNTICHVALSVSKEGVKIMTEEEYFNMLVLTDDEIEEVHSKHMHKYNDAVAEFEDRTSLTSTDMGFLIVAAFLQTLRWVFFSKDMQRLSADEADKKFKNIGEKLTEYRPATIKSIGESFINHTVPYDAIRRSERYKSIYDDMPGLSGVNHRYMALGHDPLAGLIFGTANIVTNTLTVNDWTKGFPSYHVDNQEINAKTDLYHVMKWTGEKLQERPGVVGAALLRQVAHSSSDLFTTQGLPIPVINTISPEMSRFLIGQQIDVWGTAKSAGMAIMINKIIEMCHRLFYKPSDNLRLYEVRTRKILTYSNTLSSIINIGYVGATRNVKKLDVGGILVTLWRILNDKEEIRKIKREFVLKTLDGELRKEEDEINQQLAKWGFSI